MVIDHALIDKHFILVHKKADLFFAKHNKYDTKKLIYPATFH
jgi:hypothetical protein